MNYKNIPTEFEHLTIIVSRLNNLSRPYNEDKLYCTIFVILFHTSKQKDEFFVGKY